MTGLGEELIAPSEATAIDQLVALNLGTVDAKPGQAKRGQHPKHHGLLTASFTVADNIPDHLRHGIFTDSRKYDALVRFSNGRQRDDRKSDAHGMAIKLRDVGGPKLLDGHEHETTQDFVLVDHECFFLGGISDYLIFSRDAIKAKSNKLWGLLFLAQLKIWNRALGKRVFAFTGQTPSSPLTTHYWSSTPYRLGGQAVHYMVVSPLAGSGQEQEGVADRDGLAQALTQYLATDGVTFDFGVWVQTDPVAHPVEDPTVNWREKGAPFVKLASIEIPAQQVEPGALAAESIVFSPWNVIAAHRPLGAINRSRRAVYRAMAERRHEINGVAARGSSEVPEER